MRSIRPQALFGDFFAALLMMRSFFPYVRTHRWRILLQILFGILGSALMAVTPLIAKFVFDEIVSKKNLSLFVVFAVSYTAAFLCSRAVATLLSYISLYVKLHVDYHLQVAFMNRLGAIPCDSDRNGFTGKRMFMINSDISSVNGLITSIAQDMFASLSSLAVAAVAMFHLDWRVAIPVLLVAPVTVIVRIVSTSFLKKQSEQARTLAERTNGVLFESLTMMPAARLLGHERELIRQYISCLKERVKLQIHQWRVKRWLEQIQWVVESGPGTVCTCYIWVLVIMDKQTVGSAVAFSMYINMVLPPVLSCLGIYQKLVVGLVAGERLLEFLHQTNEVGRHLPCLARITHPPSVRFEHVTFSYEEDRPVLDDISLFFPAGTLCVVMGPNGSGKSTIINLICRLYLPQAGSIYVDDQLLDEVNPRSVRRQISVVPQRSDVFTGTIRHNLCFANTMLSDGQLELGIELACAGDFINSLSGGLDTMIHSEHTSLSAGQRQRLVLARALLAQRDLMLLDEPFANIDVATQGLLWRNLHTLRGRQTIIVVTHCPPPLELIDRWFWLDEKGIKERTDCQHLSTHNGYMLPRYAEKIVLSHE